MKAHQSLLLTMLVMMLAVMPVAAQEPRVEPGGAPPPGRGQIEIRGYARAIDGDTIETSIDNHRVGVRLIGYGAPQGNTPCGEQATAALEALIDGGLILEEDPTIVALDDQGSRLYYGRTLDGRSIAEAMVAAGLGYPDGHGREQAQLAAAASQASATGAGCIGDRSGSQDPQDAASESGAQPEMLAGENPPSSDPVSVDALKLDVGSTAAMLPGGPSSPPFNQSTSFPSGFVQEVAASGFTRPTGFAFLPDGRMLVAEKRGTVRIVRNGQTQAAPFIDLTDRVNDYWDRGLLGIAVDPNFAQNGFVYLYYVYENDASAYDGPKTNRLTRVKADGGPPFGDTATLSSETVLVGHNVGSACTEFPAGSDCIPGGTSHNGGGLKITPDGTIFLTTGDASSFTAVDDLALRSQDVNALSGKLLRVSTTGAGLPDNPFWNGDPNAARSKVWAFGLRNPFRLNLHPTAGIPYVGDVGWNGFEEINAGVKGANFGWPCYEGSARQAGYEPKPGCQSLYAQGTGAIRLPVFAYPTPPGGSVTAGPFYTATAYPAQYQGAYFFGDFQRGFIRYMRVDANHQVVEGPTDFAAQADYPVDIQLGPDGNLYYLPIFYGHIRRVRYTGSGGGAPTVTTTTPPAGATGVSPTANVSAVFSEAMDASTITTGTFTLVRQGTTTPIGGAVTYAEGSRTATLNPTANLDLGATYTATLTTGVRDSGGTPIAANVTWTFTVTTTQSTPPTVQITSPVATSRFKVGDVIDLAGSATDSAGNPIPANQLTWTVDLEHCPGFGTVCHDHPFYETTGGTASITAPDHGDGTRFKIVLAATDNAGVPGTAEVTIEPQTLQITLATNPPGLQVVYDGTAGTAPVTKTTIANSTHSISAPSPQGGRQFQSWSDSGAQQHNVTVGQSDVTYTATFSGGGGEVPTSCPTGQFLAQYFANPTLSGQPALVRCEPSIDYGWQEAPPAPGLPADQFSVRWTGKINVAAGTYTFVANTDDGMRVWVDGGAPIIDSWKIQGETEYRADKTLTAGEHDVKVEYYEDYGWAAARLRWQPGGGEVPKHCPVGQFLAEYFVGTTPSGQPVLVRCETEIDYGWQDAAPAPGLPADQFSVRWTGKINVPADTYTFVATADDGFRLWVDGGKPIIDSWKRQSETEYRAEKTLAAGEHAIKVEYYDNFGWATARLRWETAPPASAACSPRPPVAVVSEPAGPGQLRVTVRAMVSDDQPANSLSAVRFTRMENAVVRTETVAPSSQPFAVPAAQGTRETTFIVQRQTPGQATTVHLEVTDACGTWPTFVGGGPSAF